MNKILWLTGRYATLVLLIFLVFLCRSNFASNDSVTSENVQVEGDRISVQAKEIILGELLKSIEKSTGIAFELNKALLEKEITISFKELSLLEGIKKIIYPLNYAIIYDPGDVVSKVIIVDRSNASPMTTLNVENNVFPPGSYDGSPIEDTSTEGEGVGPHTPPGSKLALIEGPPGTNIHVQGPPDSVIHLIEGPPGTDELVKAPPSLEIALIEGPPGTDELVEAPPSLLIALIEGPPGIVLIEGPPGTNYPVEGPPGADDFESQSPPPDSFQDSYPTPEEINALPRE